MTRRTTNLLLLLTPAFTLFFMRPGLPCSSAIITAAATPDQRPLLWKHRDTKDQRNDLRYFRGPRFQFIGLVNTDDTTGTQVWMGGNSAGFAVMNTNAYNLEPKGRYHGPMDQDGILMKEALGTCDTVDDFERLLERTNGSRGVKACFGVIDAHGGAAYFEASQDNFQRFDATDPAVAPNGYLIRTNFGFSGTERQGSGYVRYDTLESLFAEKHSRQSFTPEFLLLDATRCLRHSVLGTDLCEGELPAATENPALVVFDDYVVGYGSASTMVVQGVRPGENPALATIWTVPAFQLTSVCVPTWVAAGEPLPAVVTSTNGEPSLITRAALERKKLCFPLPGRDGENYLDLARVMNQRNSGYLQRVRAEDEVVLARSRALLESWRQSAFNPDDARQFYTWIDQRVAVFYQDNAATGR